VKPQIQTVPPAVSSNRITKPSDYEIPPVSRQNQPSVKFVSYVPDRLTDVPSAEPNTSPLVFGFFVDWDDYSFTSLRRNIDKMDRLVPEWLHLSAADGTIVDDDKEKEEQVLNFVRREKTGLTILPLINNINPVTNQWDGEMLAKMLADPDARSRAVQSLLQFVRSNHLAGINIDFEEIPSGSQADLVSFMDELSGQFHPLGLEVSMDLPFSYSSSDINQLADDCDDLIFMGYDQHWSTGDAGPIASQDWFTNGLTRLSALVPADKLVLAVGNYGYDWAAQSKNATELTFQEAVQLARDKNASVVFDQTAFNPTFTYTDSAQKTHTVWYLDGITTFNQLVAAEKVHPHGYALWRLGSEDPSVWNVFASRSSLNASSASSLQTISYGNSFYYQGEGEVLKISTESHDGSRVITTDSSSHLVTSEKFATYPSPYTITRWGSVDPKEIALTFDDGPDATYTPQILDILRKYKVPGTFFIIGENGNLNPELLHRIVDEGNEIGNHTYTHPDISAISNDQLILELKATQALFESRLGIQSILFRPPYGEDFEPQTIGQITPLDQVSRMGYYTIGMQVDPEDWLRPGVSNIVNSAVSSVLSGAGNIILLHDGGGDRSQTVAALPQIITQLESKGYRFGTVSDLMGLKRDQVMPPSPRKDQFLSAMSGAGFMFIGRSQNFFSLLYVVIIVLGIARMFLINNLAVVHWFRTSKKKYSGQYHPSVGVIIPAYNEVKVIQRTVQSVLNSDYSNLEVIVVDDGSTDGTADMLRSQFLQEPRLIVLSKSNNGKSTAINYGLTRTDAEVIVLIDADTQILPQSIPMLVRHLEDPKVGAVAGNAKVGNRNNLLTKSQALEYITSQNLDRRAFAMLNCITVVPGAIGVWRRELIKQANGFSNDTLAEDTDLTLKMLSWGYKIEYEDQAIALTEAPDSIMAFLKQRFRWMYGTLQAAWKYKYVTFQPKYGSMGFVALPNIFIFQILFPLLSPLMDLSLVLSLVDCYWIKVQHPNDFSYDSLLRILLFYVLFLVIDFISSLISFILEEREDWKLLVWLFCQRFMYRQLMYYVSIKSTITAVQGKAVGWNKLERKGTVKI
jgi:cellulose synthase/poly-beta-1,6-N-acetylglucosamine synthase-like glycosyltransferase/peptidoglycan/xylan/chitin deacetylase (PgdA/CDA1 family)/spore germination protein YaaH